MNSSPQERYLYKPFLGSSHTLALQRAALLPRDIAVLDIGAGSGAIAVELAQRGFADLAAVEIDPRACEHIRPHYRRVEQSIEPFEREGAKFGLILLLDVIEHMTDPEEFLRRVAALLRDDGLAIISVPNVAHWSVRLLLLFGSFEYTERGILDKTHFQFFTRSRFHRMLERVPLRITGAESSIPPVQFVLPEAITRNVCFELFSKAHLWAAQTFPGLFAYQHLAFVKRIR